MRRFLLLLASQLLPAVAVCLLCGSCNRGPVLHEVSGTVLYDGRPLPAGVIYFDPDVRKQNDGPQGYAIIKDGVYTTATMGGKGTVGGPHLARIEGFDGKPGQELPLGRSLFTDFQQAVDLPKGPATQDFDVPAARR